MIPILDMIVGTEPGHLLAVDMGLRTGLALYGPDGRLKRYRSKHFASRNELRRGISSILRDFPPLDWIWLEGGGEIAEVWQKHAERKGITYQQVQAEDWRPSMMLPRQQRNGELAKREADGIARKIIEWSGASRPKSDLKHDVAEAILLGMYGSIKVGLLERRPEL